MVAPFERFDLTGKTALVTGGATGLGFHMTKALARAGASVLITARREDVLKQSAELLMQDSYVKNVSWHRVDLGDRDSVDALINHANSALGGIDIFIGNAADTFLEQIVDIDLDSLDNKFQTNLISNMQFAKAFLPRMRERKWGRFIFSSSIASTCVDPQRGTATYAATKAGLNGFCRQIAADMGHYNITANSLILGFFTTDIVQRGMKHIRETRGDEMAQKFINDFVSLTALGRFGDPAEVEGLIQLLASDAGSFITGASLAIDGGMSIMMCPLPVG
ncbi:MAG: SDR family NAD(P)-dependent oxidoreductase [Sterolibacterium sp.]|nr:SDR family NAD(P)-dependent oxidoreductase [Sterolibacterium sp.]